VAIGMLYDRAWGRPKEYDPAAEHSEDKSAFNPRDFSIEELEDIERVLRLMVDRAEAVQAGKAVAASGGGGPARQAPLHRRV